MPQNYAETRKSLRGLVTVYIAGLDANLVRVIEAVKAEVDVKVATPTNVSILRLDDVHIDLLSADLVSVKVDAVDEGT